MAVREMKMIPNKVGGIVLGLGIDIEVSDGYDVGFPSPSLEILSRRISSARISASVSMMIM